MLNRKDSDIRKNNIIKINVKKSYSYLFKIRSDKNYIHIWSNFYAYILVFFNSII